MGVGVERCCADRSAVPETDLRRRLPVWLVTWRYPIYETLRHITIHHNTAQRTTHTNGFEIYRLLIMRGNPALRELSALRIHTFVRHWRAREFIRSHLCLQTATNNNQRSPRHAIDDRKLSAADDVENHRMNDESVVE